MAAMSLLTCLVPMVLVGGVGLLGIGGYLLYIGFGKEPESPWLGSQWTPRVLGIVCILGALGLFCGGVAFFLLPMGIM